MKINGTTYIHSNGYLSAEAAEALWDELAEDRKPPMVVSSQDRRTAVGPLGTHLGLNMATSLEEHLQNNRSNLEPQIFLVNIHQGHWTAMSVQNTDGKAQVMYLDSITSGRMPPFVSQALDSAYGKSGYQNIPIEHPNQQKGVMCGYHSCLNAIALTDATASRDPKGALEDLLKQNGEIHKQHQNAIAFIRDNGEPIFARCEAKRSASRVNPTLERAIVAHGQSRTERKYAFAEKLHEISNKHSTLLGSNELDRAIETVHSTLQRQNVLDITADREEFRTAIKSIMLNPEISADNDRLLGKIFAIRSLQNGETQQPLDDQVSAAILNAVSRPREVYNTSSFASRIDLSRSRRERIPSPTGIDHFVSEVSFEEFTAGLNAKSAKNLDETIKQGIEKLRSSYVDGAHKLHRILDSENQQREAKIYTGLGVEGRFYEQNGTTGLLINTIKKGSPLEGKGYEKQLITHYGVRGKGGQIEWQPITSKDDYAAIRNAALSTGSLSLKIVNAKGKITETAPLQCCIFNGEKGKGEFSFAEKVAAQGKTAALHYTR